MDQTPENDWVRVAAIADLAPGAVVAAEGEGELVVAHLDEAAYVAAAACPACPASLAGGTIAGGHLRCPCGERSFPFPADTDLAPDAPAGPRRYAAIVVDEEIFAHVPD